MNRIATPVILDDLHELNAARYVSNLFDRVGTECDQEVVLIAAIRSEGISADQLEQAFAYLDRLESGLEELINDGAVELARRDSGRLEIESQEVIFCAAFGACPRNAVVTAQACLHFFEDSPLYFNQLGLFVAIGSSIYGAVSALRVARVGVITMDPRAFELWTPFAAAGSDIIKSEIAEASADNVCASAQLQLAGIRQSLESESPLRIGQY